MPDVAEDSFDDDDDAGFVSQVHVQVPRPAPSLHNTSLAQNNIYTSLRPADNSRYRPLCFARGLFDTHTPSLRRPRNAQSKEYKRFGRRSNS